MRALVLSIVLLVASPTFGQQLKSITNSIGMKLVLIHAGSFTMGSPDRDKAIDFGTPHEVTISNSFYLAICEISQVNYAKVMGYNASHFRGNELPVETVSWNEAVSYCKHLSELPDEKSAGRVYRLPSEAEWEYACRATSGASYSNGDSDVLLDEHAWFGEGAQGKTHPVGIKKANRWGIFDMHGNVLEWCQDWYEVHSVDDATDSEVPPIGSCRVIRGGSWVGMAYGCRASIRLNAAPTDRKPYIGFRVAMSLPVKRPEAAPSK